MTVPTFWVINHHLGFALDQNKATSSCELTLGLTYVIPIHFHNRHWAKKIHFRLVEMSLHTPPFIAHNNTVVVRQQQQQPASTNCHCGWSWLECLEVIYLLCDSRSMCCKRVLSQETTRYKSTGCCCCRCQLKKSDPIGQADHYHEQMICLQESNRLSISLPSPPIPSLSDSYWGAFSGPVDRLISLRVKRVFFLSSSSSSLLLWLLR